MGFDNFQTVSVPMVTLDSFLADHKIENVDFIKLDIEGAELMFLRGATSFSIKKYLRFLSSKWLWERHRDSATCPTI